MTIKIDGYTIDASLTEAHKREADVTEFPVESGTDITDHVRIKPTEVVIKGLVSDTPVSSTLADLRSGSNLKPSEEARVVLEATFEARNPVTIETELATYENMVLQSLSVEIDRLTGDCYPFEASFRQVIIETNQRVVVRSVAIGQGKVNRGNKYGKPPGWIGTDKQGRDIISNKLGPGVEPSYTRADGSVVPLDEARAAAARNDAVLVKYDKDGHAIPTSIWDSNPTQQKSTPAFWAPTPYPTGSIFNK